MRRLFKSNASILVLFIISCMLLAVGTVGAARAEISRRTEDYEAEIHLKNIGNAIVENERTITDGDLLKHIVEDAGDKQFYIGKEYPEFLSVKNTADINQYVRVTIYKYWVDSYGRKADYGWVDGKGTKTQIADPSLLELRLINQNYWIEDTSASTPERTVLYYTEELKPGQETKFLSDMFKVNINAANSVSVKTSTDGGFTTNEYDFTYNGMTFVLKIEADSVQNHHASDAMISAWGKEAPA